jgi:hypothetical protein
VQLAEQSRGVQREWRWHEQLKKMPSHPYTSEWKSEKIFGRFAFGGDDEHVRLFPIM